MPAGKSGIIIMLDKTFSSIREAEKAADKKIRTAVKKAAAIKADAAEAAEVALEEFREELDAVREEIISGYVKEAESAAEKLRTEAEANLKRLDKLSGETGRIAEGIIRNLLEKNN